MQAVPLSAPVETKIEQSVDKPVDKSIDDKPQDTKQQQKFAALVRKEKSALQKIQEAQAKEQAILAKEQEISQREARIKEFESIRTQSPLKALEMLGYNYNQLSEAMLNGGNITPEMQIKQVDSKIEAFRKEQEQKEKESKEAAEKQALIEQNEVLEAFQQDIKTFVEINKSKYPLIDIYDEAKLVFASIDDHYTKTGKIVSIAEACDFVEKHLEGVAEKALGIEKIRSKVLPPQKEAKQYTPIWETPKPKVKTLSNEMSQTTPTKPKRLSEDEKIKRAVERVWANR